MGPSDATRQDKAGWQPIADDTLAVEARESVDRILVELIHEVQSEPPGLSLPDGSTGYALALAVLADCLNRPDLMGVARTAWHAAVADLGQRPSIPALYGGFSGPGWVDAHLGGRFADDADEDFVHEEIESVLLARIEASPQDANYDLISGLVGFGVYALERWPRGLSTRIVERVVAQLVALAEVEHDGITWTTAHTMPAPIKISQGSRGYRNLGLAHGIPGVLAFLGRASCRGCLGAHGAWALEGGVEWLLRNQRPLAHGLRYPAGLPIGGDLCDIDRSVSRVAWCYGDLGVAAALLLAGICHERADWSREAVLLAGNCAAVTIGDGRVQNHGLCHGSAGVGHVLARMAQVSGSQSLRDAARSWFRKTLETRTSVVGIDGYATFRPENPFAARPEFRDYRFVRDASFLTGASGVALALAGCFSAVNPSWDRVLLLSD